MDTKNKNNKNKNETGSPSKPGGSTATSLSTGSAPASVSSGKIVTNHGTSTVSSCSGPSTSSSGGRIVSKHGPSTATNTKEHKAQATSNAPARRRTPSKGYYKKRRYAFHILKVSGETLETERTAEQNSRIAWARKLLENDPLKTSKDFTSKRQRSLEEAAPASKRPKVSNTTNSQKASNVTSQKSFSDVLKDKIVVAVIDRSDDDGTISPERWKVVKLKLSGTFLGIMRDYPGPPPITCDGGWHQGHVKLIACDDKRSCDLYRIAVGRLGEVWPGAKLEVVDREEIPNRPRTRTWIPAEPSSTEEILEIIRLSNPSLPTHNWKVVKLEEQRGLYRCALIVINKESLVPLAETQGVIRFGFEPITLRVYKKDEVNSGKLPPFPASSEPEPATSDPGASVSFPSLDDDDSNTATPTMDDTLSDMDTEDCMNKILLDEDALLGSSSESEDLSNTVVEVQPPVCSKNASNTTD